MKKTKLLALLLVLAMALALLAGCGQTGSASASAGNSGSVSETKEPETEPTEAPAEEPTDAPEESGSHVAWPLSEEPETITVWHAVYPFLPNYMKTEDIGQDNSVLQYYAKETNVTLEATTISAFAMMEQFPVMIAAGEYTDMIGNLSMLYTGGLTAAMDDGVIIDLADYVDEYLPNLSALLDTNDYWKKCVYDDDGRMGCLYYFDESTLGGRGLVIRQDYLEKVGKDVPQTYDELHDVLTAFKTELGVTDGLFINNLGVSAANSIANGFGINANYNAADGAMPFYVEDGVVKCGFAEEGYREYVSMLADWYKEGLVYGEFASNVDGVSPYGTNADTAVYGGSVAVTGWDIASIDALAESCGDGAVWQGMADVTKTAGETLHCQDYLSNPQANWTISTDCDKVELVLSYWDYFYSQEGAFLGTWGLEGEAFEYVDGKPQYTELVTAHEGSTMVSYNLYCLNDMPFLCLEGRALAGYSDVSRNAGEVWVSNQDSANVYPKACSMTSDESTQFTDNWTDLANYITETAPLFIMGELDTDKDFDDFVERMKTLGLDECIALKQAAYDRYQSR